MYARARHTIQVYTTQCDEYADYSKDSVYTLTFAAVMLHTDLHNDNIPPARKMTKEEFVKNLRGCNEHSDFDSGESNGIESSDAQLLGYRQREAISSHHDQIRPHLKTGSLLLPSLSPPVISFAAATLFMLLIDVLSPVIESPSTCEHAAEFLHRIYDDLKGEEWASVLSSFHSPPLIAGLCIIDSFHSLIFIRLCVCAFMCISIVVCHAFMKGLAVL